MPPLDELGRIAAADQPAKAGEDLWQKLSPNDYSILTYRRDETAKALLPSLKLDGIPALEKETHKNSGPKTEYSLDVGTDQRVYNVTSANGNKEQVSGYLGLSSLAKSVKIHSKGGDIDVHETADGGFERVTKVGGKEEVRTKLAAPPYIDFDGSVKLLYAQNGKVLKESINSDGSVLITDSATGNLQSNQDANGNTTVCKWETGKTSPSEVQITTSDGKTLVLVATNAEDKAQAGAPQPQTHLEPGMRQYVVAPGAGSPDQPAEASLLKPDAQACIGGLLESTPPVGTLLYFRLNADGSFALEGKDPTDKSITVFDEYRTNGTRDTKTSAKAGATVHSDRP